MRIYILLVITLFLLSFCGHKETAHCDEIVIAPPEKLYGQLFYDVQNSGIYEFRDSKTFCDAVPKFPIGDILDAYNILKESKDTTILKLFVDNNFYLPTYKSFFHDISDVIDHIHILWDTLTHGPDTKISGTLIPLPKKYVIPGGRFREVYYWDSYFTMLGLQLENRTTIIEDIVNNFSFLIDSFGFIPNGNRTYYLSRSQPPFYSLMIGLLASAMKNDRVYTKYLCWLRKEYNFWMDGFEKLNDKNREYRRVVRLDDSTILNRYWDDLDTPRPEAFREDKKTGMAAKNFLNRNEKEVYRNIRAAAESGWDFSSRWLKNLSLYSINTTEIIPVDLNCLMYNLEMTLSKCYKVKNIRDSVDFFKKKAIKRRNSIKKFCWNSKYGYFMDYDFKIKKQKAVFSLAGVYPLSFSMVDSMDALRIAEKIKKVFLKNGGVVTTNLNTGHQWDAPNGWAPLQWITITGLRNYGLNKLAGTIKKRWLRLIQMK